MAMATCDPHLGIYSTQRLTEMGCTAADLRRQLASRALVRIRRGWFHDATADLDVIEAVRVGGVLTATSAGPYLGLWSLADDGLHVLVSRNASRVRIPRARTLCLHWARGRVSRATPVADPLQVVLDSAHCQPRSTAVALADSALNQCFVDLDQVKAVAPRLAEWCDPASQSGTETLVRVALRQRQIKARTQVWIDGVGAVDLLVGNRLVIECDSKAYHDGYTSTRDYERDQELLRQGYLVLRLKYRHVVHEWPRIEALILDMVRSRRHLPMPRVSLPRSRVSRQQFRT